MLSTLVELKDAAERIYKDVQQSKQSAIEADYSEVRNYLVNSNNGNYPLFDEAVSLACIVGDTATLKALNEESFMPENASQKEVLYRLELVISRIEKQKKAILKWMARLEKTYAGARLLYLAQILGCENTKRTVCKWYDYKCKVKEEGGEGIMHEYNVIDIATYIINYSNEIGSPVNNLKLQKLLYYVQAAALVKTNHMCFDSKTIAWKFGPAVPEAYHYYAEYGRGIFQIKKYIKM